MNKMVKLFYRCKQCEISCFQCGAMPSAKATGHDPVITGSDDWSFGVIRGAHDSALSDAYSHMLVTS